MAGLGLGEFSFGLSVCEGIVVYLNAIKCRVAELSSLRRKNEVLTRLLNDIAQSLSRVHPQHGFLAATVTQCLASAEAELKSLDNLVKSLTGQQTMGPQWAIKLRQQASHLHYPFERQKLRQLEECIDRATLTLNLAVQNLNLNISIVTAERQQELEVAANALSPEVQDIKSDVAALRSPVTMISSKLPDVENSVEEARESVLRETRVILTQVVQGNAINERSFLQTQAVQESTARIEVGLQSFHDHNMHQRSVTEKMEQLLDELYSIQCPPVGRRRARRPNQVPPEQMVARLASRPGNLKTLLATTHATLTGDIAPGSSTASGKSQLPSTVSLPAPGWKCTCRGFGGLRPRIQQQEVRLLGCSFRQTTHKRQHLPGCPLDQIDVGNQGQRTSITINSLAKILGVAIELSFCVRSGAGGWGISPSFTYHPTVDRNSAPAFRILELLQKACRVLSERTPTCTREYDMASRDRFAHSALQSIIRLFKSNTPKASPLDVDSFGQSLIYYAARNHNMWRVLSPSTVIELFQSLIDCGVPTFTHNTYGITPLELVVWLDSDSLAKQLDVVEIILNSPGDHFLPNQHQILLFPPTLIFLECLGSHRISRICAEAYGYGPLSLAVLENDRDRAESILKKYPSTIKEVNILGQNPLHIASNKPDCLKLLIKYADADVINQGDMEGETPLITAMRLSQHNCREEEQRERKCSKCHCADCVVMLLKADCAMRASWRRGHLYYTVIASRRCRARYLRHLKDRRERLKQLALTNLPFLESTSLGLHSSIVLDSRASEVLRLLQDRGVNIPQALAIGKHCRSIFLDDMFSSQTADFLFNLGFRDVDPFTNFTEDLMAIWAKWDTFSATESESFEWLSNHGLDISRSLFPSSLSPKTQLRRAVCAGHIVLYKIGLKASYFDPQWEGLRTVVLRSNASLFGRVLLAGLADNCRCRCCPGGCTPLIYLFKGIEHPHLPRYASKRKHSNFLHHISVTEVATCWRVEDHIAAMRYMTFDAFEIRHTCCNPILLPQDGHGTDDLDPIEDDDASLNVFEALVLEFEEELHKRVAATSSKPMVLADFWKNFWPTRIVEEKEKLSGSNISDYERRNAEDLGVIWDDPVKLGCEPTPAPDKNPYEIHQIEHWYYELDKIRPA